MSYPLSIPWKFNLFTNGIFVSNFLNLNKLKLKCKMQNVTDSTFIGNELATLGAKIYRQIC